MTLKETFKTIEDFRVDRCKKHKLVDILMIVFIGILCGYKSIEQIHLNAELSITVLKKYLELANGIPSSDTILRVLAGIKTEKFEKFFVDCMKNLFSTKVSKEEVLAIDGKTIRNSEYSQSNGNAAFHKAVHVVSVWASKAGLCFGQVKTEEKSNEITAIPELLELLELKGMFMTIDAMGCQKKIAEKITEKGADYLFSLKGNQEKIHEDTKEFYNHELDDRYCNRYKIQHLETDIEIGHGRIEKRNYYLCTNLEWLEEKNKWANLGGIGMVKCNKTNKKNW